MILQWCHSNQSKNDSNFPNHLILLMEALCIFYRLDSTMIDIIAAVSESNLENRTFSLQDNVLMLDL